MLQPLVPRTSQLNREPPWHSEPRLVHDRHAWVVWITGEHDIANFASCQLSSRPADALDDGDLVVDLSGVEFMDASDRGRAPQPSGPAGRAVPPRLGAAPSATARRVLAACGLLELLGLSGSHARPGPLALVRRRPSWRPMNGGAARRLAIIARLTDQDPAGTSRRLCEVCAEVTGDHRRRDHADVGRHAAGLGVHDRRVERAHRAAAVRPRRRAVRRRPPRTAARCSNPTWPTRRSPAGWPSPVPPSRPGAGRVRVPAAGRSRSPRSAQPLPRPTRGR